MFFNNDRLWHWFAVPPLVWLAVFLLVGFPLFHLLLHVPIAKIALCAGIPCAAQLAVTPWLYSARKTPQHPAGRIKQRIVAVTVWITILNFLFFYSIRRGWPDAPGTREFTSIGFGVTALFAILFPSTKLYLVSRREKDSTSVVNHHEDPL
jgi:hypothetical protein